MIEQGIWGEKRILLLSIYYIIFKTLKNPSIWKEEEEVEEEEEIKNGVVVKQWTDVQASSTGDSEHIGSLHTGQVSDESSSST